MDSQYRPDGMNIELTTRCPLHCPQCYCSLEGGKNIPLEIAVKRLAEAAAMGVSHVELSGGETMCYPHLYEVIKAARNNGILPSIAVSGWHFDDDALGKLVEAGIDMIYVSLNGPTEELNAKTRDGYDLAIHALEVLKRNHFGNAMINWVMHRDSVPYLPQMIELAEKYHVGGILIIEPKPTAQGVLETYPTADQLRHVAQMVKKNVGSVELVIQHCFSPLLALSCENKLWGNRNQGVYKGCTAGICSFSVNVDGDFIPCRHLELPEKWENAEAYWEQSEVLQKLRKMDESKREPCASCKMSSFCRHCVSVNSTLHNDLYIGYDMCVLNER